jgi:O-succinylbenzoic acid--CoA ligase
MASQVTATPMDATLEDFRTGGYVLSDRELAIDNGEILVKGPTLFWGYLHHQHDGWFRTGDMGYLDSLGRLVIEGRKDRLFISGGENIHPEEIESVIGSIDGVMHVRVEAVSDEEFGSRPVAYIETHLDEVYLRDILRSKLPAYKIPVSFLPWKAFSTWKNDADSL